MTKDAVHTEIGVESAHEETGVLHTSTDTAADHGGETPHLEHAISLPAEPVFQLGPVTVTNALLTSWLAVILIALISFAIRAKLKEVPGRFQSLFELMIEGALNLCDQVTGDRKLSKKVFPLVFTFFLFILISNWIGLLPLTAIGIDHHGTFVPFLRSGTADINTTIAFALIAVLGSNIFGAFIIGFWKTFNKYVNISGIWNSFKHIKKEPMGPVVALITFFVGLLEVIGEGAKVASLSFRLFGNVFAGEVLLVSISGLVGILAPIPFIFLEILVGVVQAVVFSMLTLVYFTIASHDHGHDNHEEHHGSATEEEVEEIIEEVETEKKENVSRVFVVK
jgi:F-type H+-transporting ATPase subunit a